MPRIVTVPEVIGLGTELDRWARVDSLDLVAPRAAAPLVTPTYDGSGQAMHPSVVYRAGGWNGYPYWMAMTPYPNADTTKENPSILCSLDGYTWVVPVGLTNPLVAYDGVAPWSDPCLFFDGDTLICLYRNNLVPRTLWAQTSTNGSVWSARTAVTRVASANDDTTAPSIVRDGTQWVMFAVDITPSPKRVVRRTASSYLGPWSAPVTVSGFGADDLWHADVTRLPDGTLHMFVSTLPGILLFASSSDGGMTWAQAASPVMGVLPGQVSLSWDRAIYKASAIPIQRADGSRWYRMWYSGTVSNLYFTGYTEVSDRRGAMRNRGRLSLLSERSEAALDINVPDASTSAIILRTTSGQTADIQRWVTNENPLTFGSIGSGGGVRLPSYTGAVVVAGGKGIGVFGHSEFQNDLSAASASGNLKVGVTPGTGGAVGAILIKNATTAPASTPALGGVIYIEAGALKYKGSSGTVTVIAPA